MRTYGQYCPIAMGAEIFAERWTPLVLRNMMVGCETFNQILGGVPGMPRSVLSERLRSLERSGVLTRCVDGRRVNYRLTDSGRELTDVCNALGLWGARWLEHTPGPLDAYLVLWYFARLVDRSALPPRRITIRVDLVDRSRPNRYWLLLDRNETEVCATPPSPVEDLVLTTDAAWLLRWHTGRVSLAAARRSGGMRFDGPQALVRDFARWGGLSPYAGIPSQR